MKYSIKCKLGMLTNGYERDKGKIYHAVVGNEWTALCGSKPNPKSCGWSFHEGDKITCHKCLKK